jgi:hypothetical protein
MLNVAIYGLDEMKFKHCCIILDFKKLAKSVKQRLDYRFPPFNPQNIEHLFRFLSAF